MSGRPVPDFAAFAQDCEAVAQRGLPRLSVDRPVLIFGAGHFARDLCATLKQAGHRVEGFIETRPRSDQLMGLPVQSWASLQADARKAQLAMGIFNRDAPLDQLESLARDAGFSDVFMPWDLYAQFGEALGWRYWLGQPADLQQNLALLEQCFHRLADPESQHCLLQIARFRLGLHTGYGSFRHPDNQYFNTLTLGATSGRPITFVDCGAYTGDTYFELAANAPVAHAYLLEPDPANYRALTAAVNKTAGAVTCLPLAVGQTYGITRFSTGQGEGASISLEGDSHIALAALDELLHGQAVDFIKYDVEGAEIPALLGSRTLIERWRPVLAISLYHRPRDLFEIPRLVSQLCEDYRLYIRQHYFNSFDSVLYAIPNAPGNARYYAPPLHLS